MRVLVTGAHGFLGRSLAAVDRRIEWIGCDLDSETNGLDTYHRLDLMDRDAVRRRLEAVRPDWIINTAALTDVDRCEIETDLAWRINVEAVEHLADTAASVGAGLVQLSTDYVFDGRAGPYSEGDEPNPLSVYGHTKLASEGVVLARMERAIVVRTLWLYGYHPRARHNFVTWGLSALARGETIRAFDDQWGNPTYVHELARVLVAMCRAGICGLYHMGGATFLTRYELMLELAASFDLETDNIQRGSTADAGLAAPRPLRSGLTTRALETQLGIRPMSFTEGLEHMRLQPGFQRDFAASS